MLNSLLSFIRSLSDFVSPRACRLCGRRLSENEDEICAVCNMRLPRTNYQSTPYDNPMARLFWGRLPVEKVAAWIYYSPGNSSCNIILDLKYYGAEDLAVYLGRMVSMEFARHGFFEGIDLIVPMPITRLRRFKRGYNQAELICRGIHEVTGLPVSTKVVKRIKFIQSQTSLKKLQRDDNVRGAFKLICPQLIAGKHILLVDDVVTTGATVMSCAEELCKAQGVRISVLSLGITK